MISARSTLVVPAPLHRKAYAHLYPGDGLEAAALLLCSVVPGERIKVVAKDAVLVPHSACEVRERDRLSWPGEFVEAAIERAESQSLTIIALHSHPGGFFGFSETDNMSDKALIPALRQAIDRPHGSAIMIPSGAIRARVYSADCIPREVDLVVVPGDDITLWWSSDATSSGPGDVPAAFTGDMTKWLKRMSAVVIGVSGTGSVTAEQVARLGFGEVILVDFDKLEHKNLNRVLNATFADAESGVLKVEAVGEALAKYRPDAAIKKVPHGIGTREAVLTAAQADVIFCCVDSAEGRHVADRLAAAMAIPLFDIGVTIPTRQSKSGARAIAEVCGRLDYVQPGGATLKDRGVYDAAMLEAEYLARAAPEVHRRRLQEGYIRGAMEEAPAVISLNMRAASDCMLEFIARTFPFRHSANCSFARTIFMLADGDTEYFPEGDFTPSREYVLGECAQEPLLGLPSLSCSRVKA